MMGTARRGPKRKVSRSVSSGGGAETGSESAKPGRKGAAKKSAGKRKRKAAPKPAETDGEAGGETIRPGEFDDVEPGEDSEKARLMEQLAATQAANAGIDTGGKEPGLDAMIKISGQKGYWDTLKSREEAKTKQMIREKTAGALADLSIVLTLIDAHKHGLVANFVDNNQRQAMQICAMLGAEGKERIVEEYLAKENKRRLEEADRTAALVVDRLKRSAGSTREGAA